MGCSSSRLVAQAQLRAEMAEVKLADERKRANDAIKESKILKDKLLDANKLPLTILNAELKDALYNLNLEETIHLSSLHADINGLVDGLPVVGYLILKMITYFVDPMTKKEAEELELLIRYVATINHLNLETVLERPLFIQVSMTQTPLVSHEFAPPRSDDDILLQFPHGISTRAFIVSTINQLSGHNNQIFVETVKIYFSMFVTLWKDHQHSIIEGFKFMRQDSIKATTKTMDDSAQDMIESLEDELNCIVCMERRKTIIYLPCKHLLVCDECIKNEKNHHECVGCRTIVKDHFSIFPNV